jgi:hypothetical protein
MDHDQSARDACEEERFCFARKWISATIHASISVFQIASTLSQVSPEALTAR